MSTFSMATVIVIVTVVVCDNAACLAFVDSSHDRRHRVTGGAAISAAIRRLGPIAAPWQLAATITGGLLRPARRARSS